MASRNIPRKNVIGDKVRESRINRAFKVTQEDLSSLLEAYGVTLTQASISKIEAGDRPVYDYELKAIGAAFAVRVGWLIDEEEL